MNRTEIFDKVQEVFREVLEDEELIIKEEYNASDIDEWDSLTHILLVVETEKKLGVKFLFPTGQVQRFSWSLPSPCPCYWFTPHMMAQVPSSRN